MMVSESREKLIEATRNLLRDDSHSDQDIHTLHVPGRIEVFGKHTDYCGGRSLLVATEQGLTFSVAARDDSSIRIRSAAQQAISEFKFSADLTPTVGDWTNYPMTVARRVARNFPLAKRGCDIAIASNLPPAAGMSSSSAMIIGTFLSLDRVNQLRESPTFRECIRSREDLSAYLGSIENGSGFRSLLGDRGVGTAGGSQDHTAILCCDADTLSRFAFCPVRSEQTIRVPEHLRFVIGVSGVVAEKTGDALHRYNAVADSARQIVRLFNEQSGESVTCLADIVYSSSQAADRVREMLATMPALLQRFEQFVEESDHLIPAAATAFAANDWPAFGECADRSQQLAERCLGNQIPQTIKLQNTARECGALASSAFGAGFGGSVWALIEVDQAEAFVRRWSEASPGRFIVTRASDGARWIT